TPRLRDTHLDVLQRPQLVRVGVHGDLHARFAGEPRMRVAEVEAVRLRVDLQERACLDRLLDHAFDLDVRRRADVDLPRGEVADHIDVMVIYRGGGELRWIPDGRAVG